jgi:hypothetical protein
LHEFDGYGHREIAKILHCTVGNSKSQLHKAKQRMRECLASRRHLARRMRETTSHGRKVDTETIREFYPLGAHSRPQHSVISPRRDALTRSNARLVLGSPIQGLAETSV